MTTTHTTIDLLTLLDTLESMFLEWRASVSLKEPDMLEVYMLKRRGDSVGRQQYVTRLFPREQIAHVNDPLAEILSGVAHSIHNATK